MTDENTPKDVVEQSIDFAYEKIVPGLTKFAVSALKLQIFGDVVSFGSHVFQRRRSIGFISAFAKEWEEACKEQRILKEYVDTENGQQSLQELFDYLDKDPPNEQKFEIMKKIFFHGASEHKAQKLNHAPYFLRLCRQLAPEELFILGICYKSYLDGRSKNNVSSDSWPGLVAEYSDGLVPSGLIEFYEQPMIDHRLIGGRNHSDGSGILNESHFRLTRLGIQLSEYIQAESLDKD